MAPTATGSYGDGGGASTDTISLRRYRPDSPFCSRLRGVSAVFHSPPSTRVLRWSCEGSEALCQTAICTDPPPAWLAMANPPIVASAATAPSTMISFFLT